MDLYSEVKETECIKEDSLWFYSSCSESCIWLFIGSLVSLISYIIMQTLVLTCA